MRINCIFKKKNYQRFQKNTYDYLHSLSSKKINNFFFNEELNFDSVRELNNCDIIWARHDVNKKILDQIKVPILIQHEKLFLPNFTKPFTNHFYYDLRHLFGRSNVYFLTDKTHENRENNIFSFSHIQHYDSKKLDTPNNRDIDILLLSGEKKINFDPLIQKFSKLNLNNFNNIVQDSKIFYQNNKSFIEKLSGKFLYKTKDSFSYFYNESFHTIKYFRKQKILENLVELKDDYNIHYYGNNENDEYRLDCSDYIEYEKFIDICKRSKIIICQTPLQNSILNERFHFALEYLSIPILERYPQYKDLNVPENLFFDYSDNNLFKKIKNILINYDDIYSEFKLFTENIAYHKYSIKEFLIEVIDLNKKKNL
jgi:hypothetical protein